MARILAVDDDPCNLRLVITVLEHARHHVLDSADGARVVELAIAHAADLVLLDVQMPEVDGLEALRRLRANPLTQHLPVAALTAHVMKGDRERLLAEGFDGYLEKPIRYKAFLAGVEELLGAKRRGT